MSWILIECTAKASLLVLLAGAAVLALRRSSAAMRHLAWCGGILAVLLEFPLSRIIPPWPLAVAPAGSPVAAALRQAAGPVLPSAAPAASARVPQPPAVGPGNSVSESPGRGGGSPEAVPALGKWVAIAWSVGASLVAVWLIAGGLRLFRITRAAQPIDDDRIAALAEKAARALGVRRSRFRLRWTGRALAPMTWGLRRPFVLLPAASAAWDDERLFQVLIHEIAHIQRADVATQALSNATCVLHWFNPLVWWAARRMLVERERACDDLVLQAGARPSAYAHELLEIARSLGAGWTAAQVSPAMARRSQISGRLLAVLDAGRSRGALHRRAAVAGLLAAFALAIPAASVTVVIPGALRPAAAGLSAPEQTFSPALQQARTGIAAAQRVWDDALKARDAAAMSRIYTLDTLIAGPGMTPARGRQEAAAAMQGMIDAGIVDLTIESLEFYPLDDAVCQVGRATFWRDSGAAGSIRFMTVWKNENGQWRIHRDFATAP